MELSLGIPAYGYPGSGVWERLVAVRAGTMVIMDPADGPGRTIDLRYTAAVSAAARQGLRVLGYITTSYGRRSAAAMDEEVDRYLQWYRPSGIFLDQVPPSVASSAAIVEVVDRIRARGLSLATNPGQPEIDPADAAIADHIVNFEGPYSSYRHVRVPAWVADIPGGTFWHLIYAVPDALTMRGALARARRAHAGIVYVTDGTMPNPWDRIPPYWREEQALLSDAPGCPG